jgi:hypothetical protein
MLGHLICARLCGSAQAKKNFLSSARRAALANLGQYLEWRTLPEVTGVEVHSIDRAEDGRTTLIMCEMGNGTTVVLSVCEGERLAIVIRVRSRTTVDQRNVPALNENRIYVDLASAIRYVAHAARLGPRLLADHQGERLDGHAPAYGPGMRFMPVSHFGPHCLASL